MKRTTPLKADPEKQREFQARARRNSKQSRRPISPASKAQQDAVRGKACIVCGEDRLVHPAHIISRGACPDRADDPLAVTSLCPTCHYDFDRGHLSILEYMEPRLREELAFAVLRHGLISTLERVTNQRWAPVEDRQRAA